MSRLIAIERIEGHGPRGSHAIVVGPRDMVLQLGRERRLHDENKSALIVRVAC